MKHYWFAASAALIIACSPGGPAPKADVAMATDAMRILSADDMQGRRAGTEGNTKARLYISAQAAKLNDGDAPTEQSFSWITTRRNGETRTVDGTNLILTIPGKSEEGPILEITAHFDHLGVKDDEVFNGADDNASGVGALLAILKSFRAAPPEHEVRIIWLDAEEMGLTGARHHIENQRNNRARVNLNLDMIAQNEDGTIYMAGSHHTPALKPLLTFVLGMTAQRTGPMIGLCNLTTDRSIWRVFPLFISASKITRIIIKRQMSLRRSRSRATMPLCSSRLTQRIYWTTISMPLRSPAKPST
jgi:Zn-dependent M28 family amino/carboxypeptidase